MVNNRSGKLKDGSSVKRVTINVERFFLESLDLTSIRIFLCKYDGFCRELKFCASRLLAESLHNV